MLSVPIVWGTFTPSMKPLLDSKHPPPVILTNLLSHAIGTLALCTLWLCEAIPRRRCMPDNLEDGGPSTGRVALASCELGVYLFFGQLTQLLGLGGTSATTNAILVQSSVVIVPLLDRSRPVGGGGSCRPVVYLRHLLPSIFALGGIFLLTVAPNVLGSAQETAAASAETSFGVLCSLASAAFYALHTVRLSEYGDVDATLQATGQIAVNTALDLLSMPVAALMLGKGAGSNSLRWLRQAWNAKQSTSLRRLCTAALWNGVVVTAATTWGMSFAQRTVPASSAVVAYAMEPLFAALFSAVFLHDQFGVLQILGGVLILAANVIVGLREGK